MQHLTDVTTENFRQAVVEPSRDLPVLVDYYAPECEPCQMLGPVLERIAEEYSGRIKLVKVNIADNPELAQRYRIRAIPTVQAFVDGKRVDEFYGALPINLVRDFVERFFPSAAALLCKQAAEQERQGHAALARDLLELAMQLYPEDEEPRQAMAWHALHHGQPGEAARLVQGLPEAARRSLEGRRLVQAVLQAPSPELTTDRAALERRRQTCPEDLAARLQLARIYAGQGLTVAALDELLAVVGRDPRFAEGVPRQLMLAILDDLGPSPLVSEYRRKLAHLLF